MRGALGFDRGFFGEPLPLADDQPGGIGMRAPCTIEYNLNQQFAQITAIATITNPPESDMCLLRQRGESIRFSIFGDNRKLAEATVNWKTTTMPLAADLTGVTKLRLEATPAGGPAWLHMGSAWIAPTLWRNPPCTAAEWIKQNTLQDVYQPTPAD
ncbi:MAG TPA: NPCBM/NEW2 domain-containing protein [Lentisphaeria bacterium]|nr:NPCBM/NEW2 domain-containing protein [Lentisphaeria bacterium]